MVLYPVIRKLQHQRVVLASASPRRQEILSNAGLRFEVVPSRFKETLDKAAFPAPHAYAVETAKQKALDVARRMHQKDLRAPDIVIGADTIVTLQGLILEKPVDKQDAYSMLSRLNGKEHSVFTGVTIIRCSSQDGRLDMEVSAFYEETRVKFSQLSEELLWDYIHSGEPMDKAGGYGIQALGGMLVEQVRGDFLNVVGFPLNRFCKQLAQLFLQPPPLLPAGDQPTTGPHPVLASGADPVLASGADPVLASGAASSSSSSASSFSESPGRGRGGGGHRGRRRSSGASRLVDSLPPAPLLDLLDGFEAAKALLTACKMQVFDLLEDEAPLSAPEVARRIAASESGTARLLDACVDLGLLEEAEGGYSNSALASLYLPAGAEFSLRPLVAFHDQLSWPFFSDLEAAVPQGPSPHPPDQDSNPERRRLALGAAHSLARLTARHVATAFDLSRFSTACDLGGGTGAVAHALARAYPSLSVTVFDLPDVLEDAAAFQPDGGPSPRVSFLPGDVFRDPLPEAELYVLSRVLGRRPDGEAHALLSRLSGRCQPGAALLVAEAAPDGARRPGPRALDPGRPAGPPGRGRAELGRLLRGHGFEVRGALSAGPPGSALDVLLAARAGPEGAPPPEGPQKAETPQSPP